MKRRLTSTSTVQVPSIKYRPRTSFPIRCVFLFIVGSLNRFQPCLSLSMIVSPNLGKQKPFQPSQSQRQQHYTSRSTVFPLFSDRSQKRIVTQQSYRGVGMRKRGPSSSSSSSTALNMVLTTPESIIEQASTINLLDDLIDESVRTSAKRPIMMQFDPSSGWIWRRWKGTVFSETWTACVRNILYATGIYILHRRYPHLWEYLNGFNTLWGQLLSVTTFTLTFFVNQSYALWRKCLQLSRRLQGRLHDIGLNLASHAERKAPTNPWEKSTYTAASRQILELMSRYIRLFNLLTYASFTRSHRPILTPRGMRRLAERGLLTPQEREVLIDAGIPATQRHSAILMWMVRLFLEGRASGHIQGGSGFEQQTMEKFHVIRSQYGAIGDELQGRMPLAYAHIVQVLVDLILWMYPIMAFSVGMSPMLVIAGTGLLTISYQGLFDLAKQFLDPYDNENYGRGEDPLSVDTLIAETNAGSVRWMYGFEEMPFSAQKLNDGEMYDYLLPLRGYSVDELAQMEEDRIQREKALEEERQREEEARQQEEEAAAAAAEEEEQQQHEVELEGNTTSLEEGKNGTVVQEFGDISGNGTTITTPDGEVVVVTDDNNMTTSDEDWPMHKVTALEDGRPVSFNPSVNETVEGNVTVGSGGIAARKIRRVFEVKEALMPKGVDTYLATLSMRGKNKKKEETENDKETMNNITIEENIIIDDDRQDESSATKVENMESKNDQKNVTKNEIVTDGDEKEEQDDDMEEVEQETETTSLTYEEYQRKVAESEEAAEMLQSIGVVDNNLTNTTSDEGKIEAELRSNETLIVEDVSSSSNEKDIVAAGVAANVAEMNRTENALQENDLKEIQEEISDEVSGSSSDEQEQQQVGLEKIDDDPSSVSMDPLLKKEVYVDEEGAEEVIVLNGEPIQESDDVSDNSGIGDSVVNGSPSIDKVVPERDDGNDDAPTSDNEKVPSSTENNDVEDGETEADQGEGETDHTVEETEAEAQPEMAPMTLEAYNEEVSKILKTAEEEKLETEAILLAKPGYDPLGWDYDDKTLSPMTNTSLTEEEEDVDDEAMNLDVLEMDIAEEDTRINDKEVNTTSKQKNEADTTILEEGGDDDGTSISDSEASDIDAEDDDNDAVVQGNEETLNGDRLDVTNGEGMEDADGAITMEENTTGESKDNEVLNGDGIDGDDVDNDEEAPPATTEAKGSDKIEPIFLDDPSTYPESAADTSDGNDDHTIGDGTVESATEMPISGEEDDEIDDNTNGEKLTESEQEDKMRTEKEPQ